MKKFNFFEFIYIWFRLQSMTVPTHQRKIAKWLYGLWKSEDRKGLLMAFRNSGKSTVVGLFCAWVLYQNSALRILVMAADYSLAKKMVRNVKRIIEQHPLTKGLKPEHLEQWASDQFTVNRDSELRDPSMLAKGIGANITGLRADIIICDDVEVPKNCDTSQKREELRQRLDELDYILTPGGMQLYIGTPHTYYTIYRTKYEPELKEQKPYLLGFHSLKLPILDAKGNSVWPERFDKEKIASIRIRSGENKFRSQMMLEAVNITDSRLRPELLQAYDGRLETITSNGKEVLKIGGKKMVSASCWWDPSFGSTNGDNSVIACVFNDGEGGYWLHDIEYIKIDTALQTNRAEAQCQKVIEFLRRNYVPSVRVEANGIGKFLPSILRQMLKTEGLKIAVMEMYSTSNKEQRILEAYDVILAAGALHANNKIWQTPFIEELREWTPNGCLHDDGVDAVAGCLLSEPVRLPQVPDFPGVPIKPSWTGGKAFKAQTKFEI